MELWEKLIASAESLVATFDTNGPEVLAEVAERLAPGDGWALLAISREEARARVLEDPVDIESCALLAWITSAISIRGALDRAARSPMFGRTLSFVDQDPSQCFADPDPAV